jgi:hypothetical protein
MQPYLAVTQDLGRKGLTDAGSRFVSSPLEQLQG